MKLTRKSILAAAIFITLFSTFSHAGKLYKWVDKNGVVSYQDQPPPKDATVLSEDEIKPSTSSGNSVSSSRLPKVVIYTVEDCKVCLDLVSALNKADISHIELPLLGDDDLRSKIILEAGSFSAPTIFIGDKIVQTNSITTLRSELKNAGFKIDAAGNSANK